MVPPQHEEVVWVLHLVAEQEQNCLEGLLAAVDVVAEEQVVGVRGHAAELEDAQEVVELAVHVADDLDGRLEAQQRGLAQEHLAGRGAHELYLPGMERELVVFVLRRLAVRGVEKDQFLDHAVDVDAIVRRLVVRMFPEKERRGVSGSSLGTAPGRGQNAGQLGPGMKLPRRRRSRRRRQLTPRVRIEVPGLNRTGRRTRAIARGPVAVRPVAARDCVRSGGGSRGRGLPGHIAVRSTAAL